MGSGAPLRRGRKGAGFGRRVWLAGGVFWHGGGGGARLCRLHLFEMFGLLGVLFGSSWLLGLVLAGQSGNPVTHLLNTGIKQLIR